MTRLNVKQLFPLVAMMLTNSMFAQVVSEPIVIDELNPTTVNYEVSGSLIKKASINVTINSEYANLSILANDKVLLDNIGIPTKGEHNLNGLIQFTESGKVELKIASKNGEVTVNSINIEDINELDIPSFSDISEKAGLDRVNSIKYGGPCIADIDQDGDYDFIVINHNAETNKLYWNNGDGTVTKHSQDLSRWYLEDLHGASCADFDNDGDLDIMQTKGGGNGKNPSLPDFWRNDNGKLVLITGDVGLTAGARGRGARWSDMDLDGDLDLMLVNAKGIAGETPQHLFYKNKGDGTFELVSVPGIELADAQRAVVTDLNGDNIDDFVLYEPTNTIWLGNGDFTFTDTTSQLPEGFTSLDRFMGATDIDIDNDGDFDLYFARGNAFGVGAKPSFDFCPVHMRMDIKIRNKGSFELALEATDNIHFHEYDYVGRNGFKGNKFPVYLGKDTNSFFFEVGGKMIIEQDMAKGWPDDISGNGIYFGYMGNGNWKSAVVINGDIFWNVGFSLSGIKNATPEFIAENRNIPDILLRNDGGKFTDVSKEWNIPQSGNHSGVSVGDLNNDGFSDLVLHRWGFLSQKPADYMLLNTGAGSFESMTVVDASNPDDKGHGDMGQIFDFDMDGDLDMLNGSDDHGMWYLYENTSNTIGNYALVKVGYSPESNIDAFSAEVKVKTATKEYRRRVGSSGEVFSQSLMNIVHFGLGKEEQIEKITVKWRNGEEAVLANKKANQIFDTDKVDPTGFKFEQQSVEIRKGSSIKLPMLITPVNACKDVVLSSSNEKVITIKDGIITAVGKPKKSATITATSKSSGITATTEVTIVDWYAIPVKEVKVTAENSEIYEDRELTLMADILPQYSDNQKLNWVSSNESIATVNESGIVSAKSSGKVTISAISQENKEIAGNIELSIVPFIEQSVTFDDSTKYKTTEYKNGDIMKVYFDYHAGSGEKIAAQDLGGIKVMFRELDYRMAHFNIEDLHKEALGTQSGSIEATLKLEGLKPSKDLPEGHDYYLIVYMASSNGNVMVKQLKGINIVE